jgi:hypothetical protein
MFAEVRARSVLPRRRRAIAYERPCDPDVFPNPLRHPGLAPGSRFFFFFFFFFFFGGREEAGCRIKSGMTGMFATLRQPKRSYAIPLRGGGSPEPSKTTVYSVCDFWASACAGALNGFRNGFAEAGVHRVLREGPGGRRDSDQGRRMRHLDAGTPPGPRSRVSRPAARRGDSRPLRSGCRRGSCRTGRRR